MVARIKRHDPELDAVITVPQAATILGVAPRTLRAMLDEGKIPYTVPRQHRRLRRGDVLAYQDSVTRHGSVHVATSGLEDLLRPERRAEKGRGE
jgi:excisionase family DNA binding protein